jgi:hypothetical protein
MMGTREVTAMFVALFEMCLLSSFVLTLWGVLIARGTVVVPHNALLARDAKTHLCRRGVPPGLRG